MTYTRGLYFLALIVLIASILLLISCSIFIFDEHVFADSHKAQLQAERDALIYQINNKLYVGNAIGEFNAKVISAKHIKLNPWTNWFMGDYILDIELIDVEEKNK